MKSYIIISNLENRGKGESEMTAEELKQVKENTGTVTLEIQVYGDKRDYTIYPVLTVKVEDYVRYYDLELCEQFDVAKINDEIYLYVEENIDELLKKKAKDYQEILTMIGLQEWEVIQDYNDGKYQY